MNRKLDTGTSIFHVMTELSNKHEAINLSQGFPGFNPDPRLLEMVCKYLNGNNNQYAPMTGVPELRESVAKKIQKFYGRAVDSSNEITICDGATEALFSIILAIVHHGDEVIVLDPAYDNYVPAVILAGGTTKPVSYTHLTLPPIYSV